MHEIRVTQLILEFKGNLLLIVEYSKLYRCLDGANERTVICQARDEEHRFFLNNNSMGFEVGHLSRSLSFL